MIEQSEPILLLSSGGAAQRTPPSELRLFGRGRTRTKKGDVFTDDAGNTELMAAFHQHGTDLPIDVAHGMLTGSLPEAHRAYGWFKPEIRDGEVWASSIEWTERGSRAVLAREFRYFSPAIILDDSRRLKRLINLALTNLPATEGLSPILNAQTLSTSDVPGTSLSAAQIAQARAIVTQLTQPITTEEAHVCSMLGLSEADFVDQRRAELIAKLPFNVNGLTTSEVQVARLLGLSEQQFAAAKAEQRA